MNTIRNRIISSELVRWKDFEFIQSESFKDLPREAHQKLKASIINNNFVESFKLWRSGKKLYCLDGFHRCQILKELESQGYKVPEKFRADFIECKNQKEASKLVLIYSSIYARITDEGMMEFLKSNNLDFSELKQLIDIPNFSLEYFELRNFTDEVKEDGFRIDEELAKIKKPVTKKGDIYAFGPHKLLCGDSCSKEDLQKLMQNQKADLVFTDPPYNVDYKSLAGISSNPKKFGGSGGKIFNDNISEKECITLYTGALNNLFDFTSEKACIYWWYANNNAHINREAFIKSKWYCSQVLIWVKNGFVLSRGQDYHKSYEPCIFGWKKGQKHFTHKFINNLSDVFSLDYDNFQEQFDIWYVKRDPTQFYIHPTQRPVRLAQRAINKHSKEGDTVIDLFGGSGSRLMSCIQMNRDCRLMELDPKFCDAIVRRVLKFSRENNLKIDIQRNGKKIDEGKFSE